MANAAPFVPARLAAPARRGAAMMAALGIALACAFVLALGLGAVAVSPLQVVGILASALGLDLGVSFEQVQEAVILSVRLPRIVLALGVGATLALAGAALQALFRNPLADPALVGVSGGAACGAVGWIVLGTLAPASLAGAWSLPLAAFVAGLGAAIAVYLIAREGPRAGVAMLLLAGLAMNALTAAILGYLIYLASESEVRALTFWLLGSLGGATWDTILPALALMIAGAAALFPLARAFDVLTLGESGAGHLGVGVERVKFVTVAAVALAAGAGVALTGVIGFLGLVAPHIVRLFGRTDHRFVLPASALLGALLLVLADSLARTIAAPAELPIGVVTSALGAPFFFWLLRRRVTKGRAL